MLLGSTYMHNSRKLPLRGLLYHHRKITFERAADVCEKQCLWVRLTRTILDVTFKRTTDVCMHYCIFIIDGGFELACVTLICIAPQFHGFISGL